MNKPFLKSQVKKIGKKLKMGHTNIIDYIEERKMGTWDVKNKDLEKDMKAYSKRLKELGNF